MTNQSSLQSPTNVTGGTSTKNENSESNDNCLDEVLEEN